MNQMTHLNEDCERLFAQSSFYTEFAGLEGHDEFVDSIYILKDQGLLTADNLMFASPLRELVFSFREDVSRGGYREKVIVSGPNFGHRKKGTAFFGWIIGIKFKATWFLPLCCEDPLIVACQNSLARTIGIGPSHLDILEPLDSMLGALSKKAEPTPMVTRENMEASQGRVFKLASRMGGSVRTLHRRVRASTGFAPKRFLALQRFRQSVYELVTQEAELSEIALDLGFSDQAHLTRDFRRHAGVTPGAFKQAWGGRHARAVRFIQDTDPSTRLRLAVWLIGATNRVG